MDAVIAAARKAVEKTAYAAAVASVRRVTPRLGPLKW